MATLSTINPNDHDSFTHFFGKNVHFEPNAHHPNPDPNQKAHPHHVTSIYSMVGAMWLSIEDDEVNANIDRILHFHRVMSILHSPPSSRANAHAHEG